jgi:threonine 3-dehydrogenase
MSVTVCAASGAAKIFAVETDDYRLNMAMPMGATRTINPLKEDAVQIILDETGGLGTDVFLEMSGAEVAIDQGLKSLRKGGRVSFLGITQGDIKLDLNDGVVFKQAVLYGINGRVMFDTWYKASELLYSGKIDLAPLVTHKMKLDDIHRSMDLLIEKKACKIVLYPEKS